MGSSSAVPSGLRLGDPEPLRLRRATEADARALALVGGATFLEAFTWMLPGADMVEFCATHHTAAKYAAYLAMPTTRITLAVTGVDIPVGYAMVTAPDLPSIQLQDGDFELKRIYLLSRFRSRETAVLDAKGEAVAGLRGGQALMDAAVECARGMGGKRLLLGTHEGNLPAIRFYERNGFAKVGTRTFQVGSQMCCDWILGKAL